ncbi:hypothetical protein J6Y73_05280 [bacterium]|nr:hypothetical protein [bacterium]
MKDRGHRGATDSNKPIVQKVKKIELNEKHIPLRVVLLIVVIIIAITAFGIFFSSLLSADPGWMVIEEINTNYPSIGQDFILNYNVPKKDSTLMKKKVQGIYSDLVEKPLILFDTLNDYEGYINLKYINEHPNEIIEVDSLLYNSFKKINEYGNKTIFLGPVYSQYRSLFTSLNNTEAYEFDAKYNDSMKEYFSTICTYLENNKINIELFENNKIRLNVLDDYLTYSEENNITDYLDFWTLKNAFVSDYIVDNLFENGITDFILSSNDGYNYVVGVTEEVAIEVWQKTKKQKNLVGRLTFSGTKAFVNYSDSPLDINEDNYYVYYDKDDKTNDILDITSRYIDPSDGIAKEASKIYYACSSTLGSADVALSIIDIYTRNNIDTSKVSEILENGIYSLYLDASLNVISNMPSDITFTDSSSLYGDI